VSREFSLKLLERVASIFALAFASTYAAGSVSLAFHQQTPLSVAQRALVAGIAAVAQLLVGVLIAPHVGNPNSPSVLPNALLRRFGTPVATSTQLVVTLEDVVGATLTQLAKEHPEVMDLKPEDVAKTLLAAKMATHEIPATPQPASSEAK
jgi:hypothetical protein